MCEGVKMLEYNTTGFGLNIGTGLMLESILSPTEARVDSERNIPNKVVLKDYDKYYINNESFITNVISSYDKETVDGLILGNKKLYSLVKERVLDELILLDSILEKISVVYYLSNYKTYSFQPVKLIKEISTETKSGKLIILVNKMANELLNGEVDIIVIECKLPIVKKSLVTTSNPLDLLSLKKSNSVLLEFHTGVLRSRNTFYTKLKIKQPIPFEEMLVYLIGDNKGILKSVISTKEKALIIDLIVNQLKLKPYLKYERGFILSMIKNKLGIELYDKCRTLPILFT